MTEAHRLPEPCVVVLVGPAASGKSAWAAAHFPADCVVSSDRLRAAVGTGEDDITASDDAFALLDTIVAKRLARRLTTVIDTLGLDPVRRRTWLRDARAAGLPCVAVLFDTPPDECRARNRGRPKRVPAAALTSQLSTFAIQRAVVPKEGFDQVLSPRAVRVVPRSFAGAGEAAARQQEDPLRVRFGLHLSTFSFAGTTRDAVRDIASAAEQAGFDAIYVMDHFRQIPQIGRPWEDFLESYTTLAYLAACTEQVRLGTLVTGVTHRNVAHLGKIIATLDVLSGGRAVCGLGLGWWAEEHRAYGWELPPVAHRYRLLEDALQVLPLFWGKGSPAFQGRVLHFPETLCYPRPLQPRVPIIVGGGGEKRTLRLAARYADAANVMGDVATVRRKTEVLREHCRALGRDPADVAMTHLSTVLVGDGPAHVAELVDRLRPPRRSAAQFAAAVNAGTVEDHVGRFRELAESGAREMIVRIADLTDAAPLERLAKVISAFR